VLIEAERGRLDVASKVKGREEEEFFISVITASELLHGVWRAKQNSKVRARRAAFVESILDRFPILPVDLTTARLHAELWAKMESKGISVGAHDSWLAATCIAHGLHFATGNVRDFKRIPDPPIEDWSA
jgi:predicted nucleic acid-binding protein